MVTSAALLGIYINFAPCPARWPDVYNPNLVYWRNSIASGLRTVGAFLSPYAWICDDDGGAWYFSMKTAELLDISKRVLSCVNLFALADSRHRDALPIVLHNTEKISEKDDNRDFTNGRNIYGGPLLHLWSKVLSVLAAFVSRNMRTYLLT